MVERGGLAGPAGLLVERPCLECGLTALPHMGSPVYSRQGMMGTVEMECLGLPSISLSLTTR